MTSDPMTSAREVSGAWRPPLNASSVGGASAVFAKLREPWRGDWPQDLAAESLEQVSLLALRSVGRSRSNRSKTFVFVDGSGPGDGVPSAGWAVAVLQLDVWGCFHFIGQFGAEVVVDAAEPGWMGATRHTNNVAEVMAVAAALAFLHADDDPSPCELWADSGISRALAEGTGGFFDGSPLADMVRPWRRRSRCGGP